MTQEEQEQLINEMEKDIDRLHALYNQYFMGIEKLEPTVVRKNLDRKINLLRREQIKNTALRFRLQMQIQKYNTQSTYWTRVCRQIEAGTYNRQVVLAKRRIESRHGNSDNHFPISETDILLSQTQLGLDDTGSIELNMDAFGTDLGSLGLDLDDPFADTLNHKGAKPKPPIPGPGIPPPPPRTASKGTPPPPQKKPGAAPPPPPPGQFPARAPMPTLASSPSLAEDHAQSLYRRYLAARKKCNEPVENLSFDTVAKSLNAKLKAEGGHVDFKVVIRNGKAIIKTVRTDGQNVD